MLHASNLRVFVYAVYTRKVLRLSWKGVTSHLDTRRRILYERSCALYTTMRISPSAYTFPNVGTYSYPVTNTIKKRTIRFVSHQVYRCRCV